MTGLAWVNKHGRGAGRCQGGGNLAANVAALAHASDDHAALHAQHQVHGLDKALVQPVFQLEQSGGLDVEGLAGELQGVGGMGKHVLHFIGRSTWPLK